MMSPKQPDSIDKLVGRNIRMAAVEGQRKAALLDAAQILADEAELAYESVGSNDESLDALRAQHTHEAMFARIPPSKFKTMVFSLFAHSGTGISIARLERIVRELRSMAR